MIGALRLWSTTGSGRFRSLACLVVSAVLLSQASAEPPSAEAITAGAIYNATGVQGGLVVHLGCGDGTLTATLRASDAYLVHGLDADADQVAKARQRIRANGLYGPISVERFDGKRLPYAEDLVNLVVVDDPGDVPMAEVMRVLVPNGVAYVSRDGRWSKTVKPRPDDIDDWTHYQHGADNNAVAQDLQVGPPRRLQWKSDPQWCRSHDGVPSSIALVLSSGGRLFSLIDEGLSGQPSVPQRWTIVARDAFNGTLLWKKRLARSIGKKSMVAVDDRLYAALGEGNALAILDGATGRTIRTCEETKGTREIVCTQGVVVLHAGGSIVAVDGDSGDPMWKTAAAGVTTGSLTATDDRVCYHGGGEVVCLQLQDGREHWRAACETGKPSWPMMVYRGAVLVPASSGLRAFSLDSGKPLWKGPRVDSRLGAFGAGGLVWLTRIEGSGRSFLWTPAPVVTNGYDPMTGRIERSINVSHLASPGHHVRCYAAKATERYLLLPKRGAEFVDLTGDDHMRHDWFRGPCRHGLVPANGLVYSPPHQCFCYPGVKLAGYNALRAGVSEDRSEAPRFVRGPAFADSVQADSENSEGDWPAYRHDAQRSGRAGCDLPVDPAPLWRRSLGGKLTQPVVADGRLVVAQKDAQTVHCLNAVDGKPLWHFIADGRIDSSPTLYRGLVLFGSADGWVYCLRASDGVLAWRFRAALGQRRIVAYERLESAWPVHGSVLVQGGIVYCTAGRSSYLDGGMRIYGLDPATGKVLHETNLESERPNVNEEAGRPFDMEGVKSDLLVSDGTDLYMFHLRFSPSLEQIETPRITKLGDRQVDLHLMSNAGFLDTTGFDRNFWTYSCRWPGFYFAYNAPKAGQILSFDDTTTYGVHVFDTRNGHSPRFIPAKNGYELFADANTNRPVLRPTAIGREKGAGFSRSRPAKWSERVPVQMKALVLAGEYLYAAGPPDVLPEGDPMAAFEGRLGAQLRIFATSDGRQVAEFPLERSPIFDGLIGAGGRLYMATDDGQLICMGRKLK
ncbi:MAG: PQQ-binding-like beta-propeller repeat protein [Thermoguttaceae bacterium]